MNTASDQVIRFNWTSTGPDGTAPGGLKIESQAFRDEQYEFINTFIEFVRSLPNLPDWYRTPVDLLEAARIELMFQSRTPVRDWISWQRLIEWKPARVEIVAPQGTADVLKRDCAQMSLPFDLQICDAENRLSKRRVKEAGPIRLAAHRLIDRLESRWVPRVRFPTANPARIRAMFLDQYPNSAHILIPVWRRLSASAGHQCLYIAGREKVRRELATHGIESLNLRRCEPHVANSELSPPAWDSLVHRFFDHLESQSRVPTPPSVRAAFIGLAAGLAEVKLSAMRLQRAFEQFRPNLLFVSSGLHSAARIAELLGRRHQCAGIHLQHGLYKGEKETRNLLSDTTCLWGDFHLRTMKQNPCAGKLLVTGSPKHDELLCKYASIAQDERPLVVFYSTRKASSLVAADDFERHLMAVYEAARTIPDVDFVVKLHPAEQRAVIESLVADRSRPTNVRITRTDDAYELLQRCHLVVTVSSTIGYEALLFRRPLLILNLTGCPDELTLPDAPSIVRVRRTEELVSAVARLLAAKKTIADSAGDYWLNDGRSLDRILKLAEGAIVNDGRHF